MGRSARNRSVPFRVMLLGLMQVVSLGDLSHLSAAHTASTVIYEAESLVGQSWRTSSTMGSSSINPRKHESKD